MSKVAPGQIRARDLGRQFKIAASGGRSLRATLLRYDTAKPREFWALRHVDLEIAPGETFGIVGRNGSGKSTLMKMLARIYGPSEGSCDVGGRMSSLLELGAGFHPDFSALENIYLSAAIYGIPRDEIHRELESIIGFAELEEFANQPVKTFSSGMFARLGFSVAMHVRPDVLLLDEVLAVGDEAFVQKCMGRISQYRRDGGTMVLVTHDPGTVERMCDRAMFLENGVPVMVGSAHDAISTYHEHLAAEDTASNTGGSLNVVEEQLIAHVDVIDAKGELRHRFTEGEAFAVRINIDALTTIKDARIGLSIRDELSREIGSTAISHVSIEAGGIFSTTVEFSSSPLRNGQFQVDLNVVDIASGETLLSAEAVESVAILGQMPDTGGPVQLGANWTSKI